MYVYIYTYIYIQYIYITQHNKSTYVRGPWANGMVPSFPRKSFICMLLAAFQSHNLPLLAAFESHTAYKIFRCIYRHICTTCLYCL